MPRIKAPNALSALATAMTTSLVLTFVASLFTACASVRPANAPIAFEHDPREIPVLRLQIPLRRYDGDGRGMMGSAVRLGGNRIITARHVIESAMRPRSDLPLRLAIDGRSPVEAEIIAHGSIAAPDAPLHFENDWIVLALDAEPLGRVPTFDAAHPLTPGTRLYFHGYVGGGESGTDLNGAPYGVARGSGAVVKPPWFFDRQLIAENLVFFQTVHGGGFGGMSGSPVAVWNEASEQLHVVGIYVGKYTADFFGFPLHDLEFGVVRRLTQDQLQYTQ